MAEHTPGQAAIDAAAGPPAEGARVGFPTHDR